MNAPIDVTGVVLNTERLVLRPWREDDLADFYAYSSEDGVLQMVGVQPYRSIEEAEENLRVFIEGRKIFALEYAGRAVGSLGVETYSEETYPELAALRGREIGFMLSKDCWGQGLMPEAVCAVIRWLFEDVRLDFIIAGHFVGNDRSRRVIEKCGFSYNKTIAFDTQDGRTEETLDYILYNPRNA